METNRTWKHYQLEERVTRAQTYKFVFFGGRRGGGFVNVVVFFCFCHLKDFTMIKDGISSHFTFSVDSYMGHKHMVWGQVQIVHYSLLIGLKRFNS